MIRVGTRAGMSGIAKEIALTKCCASSRPLRASRSGLAAAKARPSGAKLAAVERNVADAGHHARAQE